MSFDVANYKNSVLIPLAKDKARLEILQQVIRDAQGTSGIDAAARLNALELFAVEPSMSATELAAHLKSLEMVYNKQKNLPSAGLLKKLLDLFGPEKSQDPAFWAGLASSRGKALKGQLAEFANAVAEEHPLDVVTPVQVTELAAGMGLQEVPELDLIAALAMQGVQVYPEFQIPVADLSQTRKVTDFPEFRTIIDVICRPEKHSEIAVIDEFSVGSPSRKILPKDVRGAQVLLQQQESRVEAKARQAAQNVLAALSLLTTADELHALVLASFAETTESLVRRGVPKTQVRKELIQLGLRTLDASRLVAKFAGTTQVRGLGFVSELLANGALSEARRYFDSLPTIGAWDEDEHAKVKRSLEQAETKKQLLMSQYETAIKSRDFVAAATALSDALRIDTQDDDLRSKLDRLPPLPPANVSLRVNGRSLEAIWSADGDETVRYSVVRTTAEVPVNHKDGNIVASSLDSTRFRDDKVPIGILVRYSVFATRDGSSYSDPATATLVVLPSPADLAASAGATDVSLSWVTPPEAADVVVTETAPDGTWKEHRAVTPGQLVVKGLTTGMKYRFSAKAVYLLTGGQKRDSAAVELDITPRGSIRPVDDLRVDAVSAGYRARWTSVVGYTIELWALPITAHVTPKTRITSAELKNLSGRRLALRPGTGRDGETVREFDALSDVNRLIPVTLDGNGGLVGKSQVAGSAPSVLKPTSERFGEELRLSWEWPRGDYTVEVGWQNGNTRITRRVSRTSYNDNGGVRLPAAEVSGEVTLATIVQSGSQEWSSAPVSVPVSLVAPAIKYVLSIKRSIFGGKRTVTVTLESSHYDGIVGLQTVLKEAKFMPNNPSDGTVVDRRTVDLSSGRCSFSLDLGKIVTPFWVRVFPESSSGVRIEDPPTNQMRGQ